MKRIVVLLLAVVFMCTPAMAGDQPEYDTVGCDANNFFNTFVNDIVCGVNNNGQVLINEYSDFTDDCDNPLIIAGVPYCNLVGASGFWEYFDSNANQPADDFCFAGWGYLDPPDLQAGQYQSRLATAFNEYWFEWQIVLQKKPQTDLDLNIIDCVAKPNAWTLFGNSPFDGAEQTGRYSGFQSPGTFWLEGGNPKISVWALPGPNAPAAFKQAGAFFIDARNHPGLQTASLNGALYTSKALWDEAIVLIMPETGATNMETETQFRLRSGDRIKVRVDVPEMSTADIRYGQDNVSIKYIAIHGSEYVDTPSLAVPGEQIFCGNCSHN